MQSISSIFTSFFLIVLKSKNTAKTKQIMVEVFVIGQNIQLTAYFNGPMG